MKIDPVTYEVDVAAGTQPLYVWEAPVRIWHWIMAFLMFVMIATGFLIGAPLFPTSGTPGLRTALPTSGVFTSLQA